MIEVRSAGVLLKGDKILLANHFKKNKSYWVLPGGRVEFGESVKRAVERELAEESGLKVKAVKFLFLQEIILEDKHILNFYFLLKLLKKNRLKKVKKEKILKGVKFVSIKDLEKIDFRPKMFLSHLLKGIKNNFKECPKFLL